MALLTELGATLKRDGLHGDIYIVGGTAIALTIDARRVTEDIDVAFRAAAGDVRTAAREVAQRHGLDDDWINNHVTGMLPNVDDPEPVVLDVPGLSIAVASPEHVLAMKMIAARPGRDQDDLEVLFERVGITTPEQAVEIVRRVYGDNDVMMSDPIESYVFEARDVLRRIAKRKAEPSMPLADPRRYGGEQARHGDGRYAHKPVDEQPGGTAAL